MESLTLKNSKWAEEDEQKETFIAFARVYSGVVKKGLRLFVLGPKYDPAQGLSLVNLCLTHSLRHLHRCLLNNIQSYRNDNLNFLFCSDLSNDNSYYAPLWNQPQRNLFLKLSRLVFLVDQKKMNIFFNHFTYFLIEKNKCLLAYCFNIQML